MQSGPVRTGHGQAVKGSVRWANGGRDERWGDLKLERRIPVLGEGASGDRDAGAASLDQTQHSHGFGQIRIAVVSQARCPERLDADLAVRAARIRDLETIVVRVDSDRSIGRL